MKTIFLITFLLTLQIISAQKKTLTLRADADNSKFCMLWFIHNQNGRYGKTNSLPHYTWTELDAQAWTWDGASGTQRALFQFNLSSIPKDSKIIKATLSLYGYKNHRYYNGHTKQNNSAYLERITTYWNPYTCCWKNQPNVSKEHRVKLPAANSKLQNYTNIDVTNLVQDMTNEPENSFGFRLSLADETAYRMLLFASPNHPNLNLHPVLKIEYKSATEESKTLSNAEFCFEKEPEPEFVEFSEDYDDESEDKSTNDCKVEITNSQHYKVLNFDSKRKDNTLIIKQEELQKGEYIFKVKVGDKVYTRKLIIE